MRADTPIYRNPYLWASFLLLTTSLMIVGWVYSYPVARSPAELPVLSAVSPLFWVGLWLSFFCLAGLVTFTTSKYLILACTSYFVFLFTVPQFLYLSYGSDAGMLAEFVNYSNGSGGLDLSRDIVVNFYFQWPLSIFFHQFLADLFQIGVYPSLLISFIFVILGISGGFIVLWSSNSNHKLSSTRAVFWGVAVYFCGLYWLFNWQIVPFIFALIWFIPLLNLLVVRPVPARILGLLFFIALIETHAMLGVWLVIVAILLLVFNLIQSKRLNANIAFSFIVLMIVVQVSIIVYKNLRFFSYVIWSVQGLYSQILLISTSDRTLALHASRALSNSPTDIIGNVLKTMGWFSLGLFAFAYLISTLLVLVKRRVRAREIAFLISGVLYFVLGTQMSNIGIRSILLISLAPAYFIIDSLRLKIGASRVILMVSLIGFLLFPAALVRSHQNSTSFITPTDLLFRDYLIEIPEPSISGIPILQEHVKPLSLNHKQPKISPRRIGFSYKWQCSGPILLNDTQQLRADLSRISPSLISAVDDLLSTAPQFYDNGSAQLRYLSDCKDLQFTQ